MTKDDKRELEKQQRLCQVSLKFLCKEILGMADWSGVHDELAQFLSTSGRRKHIELARGHLKSSIVTKGWTIQQVLKNPDIRILLANAVWDNARKFLRSIQKYIASGTDLEGLFGAFVSPHWNQDECTVLARTQILDAPTWATTGIEKEQTSQHYDLIIADDLVARENVMTPEQREKVYLYYKDLLDLLEPDGTIVVIGTRWHQDDLYAKLLEENDEAKKNGTPPVWDVFIRSAYLPDGNPTFPTKFSLAYLDSLRASKGSTEFACQYLNNPLDQEAADFKQPWIRTYTPGTAHPTQLYLTVDPALSLSRDADPTGMIVAGQFSNRVIRVVDYVRKRMMPTEIIEKVFELVDKWKLHRVGVESFAYQKTLMYSVKNEMQKRNRFFSLDELGSRRGGREPMLTKEARIRRLVPYFEQGLVEIRFDMKELEDELLAFPRGRYDDLIDALSYQLDFLYPSQSPVETHAGEELHWRFPTFRQLAKQTWNKGGTGVLERYFNDLRSAASEPVMR